MKELNCDPDLYPGFAFNPDTILRIEILIQSGDASRHNDPINNHNGIQFLLNPDTNEQPHAILIETLSDIAGDEGAISTESNLSRDIPITWKIITLHINSCILAAKSCFFFRKLFPNGKSKSSIQRHITLRIHSSEEDALMELLNFMYSNTLAATSLPALLDVLRAAHKFEVASCMRYCKSNLSRDIPITWKIITLHINSCILAAKSCFFFRKLFPNGKSKSSIQRHITLRIHSSEEDALMELLNFMYSNTLAATSLPALLDVLRAAHKFEVASCMRYCNQLLRSMSMTLESALFYLEQVPSSVLMADELRPLTDAAKQYLCTRYKDITKFQEEVMGLPLVVLEVILSNDDLEVPSEDVVYDFVLKWACTHYPNLEERREVLGTRLAHLIRFPYMTCPKLKNVLTCNDFEHKAASKLVLEALFFKAEAPHRQRILAAQSASLNRIFVKRSYKYQPVRKLTWIYIPKLLILGCRFDFIFFGLFFALFLWLSVVTLR